MGKSSKKNYGRYRQITMLKHLINHRVIRYIISGGIAALVLFGTLFLAKEIFQLWYLLASTIAFVVTFITSFLLQKLWTFQNNTFHKTKKQLTLFFLVSLFNLCANTILMYVLVDTYGLWYMFAQFIVITLIAFWGYFVYKAIFSFH
jgi:putative flippase GtrA